VSLENKNNKSSDELTREELSQSKEKFVAYEDKLPRKDYEELSREITKEPVPPFNPKEHDSKSRYKITIIFIGCYFGLLVIVFSLVAFYNSYAVLWKFDTVNLKDMISLFVASFGSTLGFIIGYYFKAGDKG
jgi:hypothetical protein